MSSALYRVRSSVGNIVRRAEGLHGEVVGNDLALVMLIERLKLFLFRYRHTFGIVQAELDSALISQ